VLDVVATGFDGGAGALAKSVIAIEADAARARAAI
jgi:hypothetical protein